MKTGPDLFVSLRAPLLWFAQSIILVDVSIKDCYRNNFHGVTEDRIDINGYAQF